MRIILILLSALLVLSGCATDEARELSYSEGAFECELCWSVGGVNIRGVLSADERAEGQSRDVSLRLSEPPALCGAMIRRVGGETSLEIGDVQFCDVDMSGLLDIERLIDCRGRVTESSLAEISGTRVNKVVVENDGVQREVYIDSKGGVPLEVRCEIGGEAVRVRVIYFTAR